MKPEFHLSPEEAALVSSGAWLITKQRIIGKVYGLFGMITEKYSEMIAGYAEFIPEEVLKVSPKIYKGEMYRQLPYVMLDQPRYFDQENVFAVRSFFWWGNSFSIHLVLAGRYKQQYEASIKRHITEGALDEWYVGVSDDPWEHHFEADNYRPVHHYIAEKRDLPDVPYLKLARVHPLDKWKDAYDFYLSAYTQLLECIV